MFRTLRVCNLRDIQYPTHFVDLHSLLVFRCGGDRSIDTFPHPRKLVRMFHRQLTHKLRTLETTQAENEMQIVCD